MDHPLRDPSIHLQEISESLLFRSTPFEQGRPQNREAFLKAVHRMETLVDRIYDSLHPAPPQTKPQVKAEPQTQTQVPLAFQRFNQPQKPQKRLHAAGLLERAELYRPTEPRTTIIKCPM